jgi:hypothetical protein
LAQAGGVDVTRLRGIEADVEDQPAFIVQFGETPLVFIIRNEEEEPHSFEYAFTRFGVKTPDAFSFEPSTNYLSFEVLSKRFSKWVSDELRGAIEDELLPDFWSLLADGQILGAVDDETPFTADERSQIKLGLNTFKILISREFNPTGDETTIISDRLDYLADAVDRLNRFDWRGVMISTLMGISITLSLDTEHGRTLYALFQQAMTSVMHLLK